jgi:hypothetical protein
MCTSLLDLCPPLRTDTGATMLVMTGGYEDKCRASEPVFIGDTESGPCAGTH